MNLRIVLALSYYVKLVWEQVIVALKAAVERGYTMSGLVAASMSSRE